MMMAAPMEAQTVEPPSDRSSAAAYPRWVMLEKDVKIEKFLKIEDEGTSCSTSGASNTQAAASTSTGHLIHVSLRLAEPPAVSCVCLQIPDDLDARHSTVLAAHGDFVLIDVSLHGRTDHFVYSAGAAAVDPPRPPSLSLLPPSPLGDPTGLVRCGEGVVVVAELVMVLEEPDTPELMREANLSLFRSGEWSINHVQIRFPNTSEVPKDFPFWDAVVPVSDGLLCWVHQWLLAVLLCDVSDEETTRLQYLPLPMENIWGLSTNRNVCATAGGDALKFVNIFPRCCCGAACVSSCRRSCHAYTIQTWTMTMGNNDLEWVKDGIVDSSELWELDSYKGHLRCLPLENPVVSLDEPEHICFCLQEPLFLDGCRRNTDTVDVLMINMRTKTIHSVLSYEDGLSCRGGGLVPCKVSYFFNSNLSSRSDPTFTGERQLDTERPPPVIIGEQLTREDDDGSNPTKPAFFTEPSLQASEIFDAFQEIPSFGLDHDQIIKAYRILGLDNCRRFRSFIRLPKNTRKDWLLMEIIKASED